MSESSSSSFITTITAAAAFTTAAILIQLFPLVYDGKWQYIDLERYMIRSMLGKEKTTEMDCYRAERRTKINSCCDPDKKRALKQWQWGGGNVL